VLESAACLIGHAPSLATLAGEGETGALALLMDAIDGVRGAEGWLHLEVVGDQSAPGPERAVQVADHLRDQGASHIVRGEVWNDGGSPGWRVTALLPAKKLTPCRRVLLRLGASRVVGLPPLIVYDRDATSTFNDLCGRLMAATDRESTGGSDRGS
jgi:ATP phosphoribosyltransferase